MHRDLTRRLPIVIDNKIKGHLTALVKVLLCSNGALSFLLRNLVVYVFTAANMYLSKS